MVYGYVRSAIHLTKVIIAGVEFFRYPHIKHDPLTRAEAKRCLMALYRGLYNALEEVHSKLGLAHMDVRLPNICFNNLYEPVLIDLDRSLLSLEKN